MNTRRFFGRIRRWWLLPCLGIASTALAQGNLIVNAGFDTDLSGWDNPQARSALWSELDPSNSPASGSALIANVGSGNNTTQLVLNQCVPANGSVEYRWGGQVRLPSLQPEFTSARIMILIYDSADCSGSALQIESVGSVGVDEWELTAESIVADSAAQSIRIGLGIFKPSGVDSEVNGLFDNIFLRRADASGFRIIDERLSGSWYNPATPGQGFFLDISPQINLFFGGWFTWTSVPGEYDWMTVQGGFSGDLALVPIYRTSGGAFNDPTAVLTDAIGSAEFRFFSCTTGQVSFTMQGGPATPTVIPLLRIGPAFKGCTD